MSTIITKEELIAAFGAYVKQAGFSMTDRIQIACGMAMSGNRILYDVPMEQQVSEFMALGKSSIQ